MNYIFFFFGIIAIMWELISIKESKKVQAFGVQLKKDIKTNKFDGLNSNQQTFSILMLLYFIWVFTGLLTKQWLLFLVLILISFIPKKFRWYRIIDSFISLFIIIFSILNEFHLHINLWNELLKLLK